MDNESQFLKHIDNGNEGQIIQMIDSIDINSVAELAIIKSIWLNYLSILKILVTKTKIVNPIMIKLSFELERYEIFEYLNSISDIKEPPRKKIKY